MAITSSLQLQILASTWVSRNEQRIFIKNTEKLIFLGGMPKEFSQNNENRMKFELGIGLYSEKGQGLVASFELVILMMKRRKKKS